MVVDATSFGEPFDEAIRGHWLDSIGNTIIVSRCPKTDDLKAVLSPLLDHPEAKNKVFAIRQVGARQWRCGNASLEWVDEHCQRLVWVSDSGRRSVWSRDSAPTDGASGPASIPSFPWLLKDAKEEVCENDALQEPAEGDAENHGSKLADVLMDSARVAALLDIRQIIGPKSEHQEKLTHILMDHDLSQNSEDYLVPGASSSVWAQLNVSQSTLSSITQRIERIPLEPHAHSLTWSGQQEVWVGHHKISCQPRDIQALDLRWQLGPTNPQKEQEMARLLAMYSIFDNPLSGRRSGLHLGLDPQLRLACQYELFASPLNAVVPNGCFASKWPHVEWRFGSMGRYPLVLNDLPRGALVCINPPFTKAYLTNVMSRLPELKERFRLRLAVPIQDAGWRSQLAADLPGSQLLHSYYDASQERPTEVLHPTLLWEDPRCPSLSSLHGVNPAYFPTGLNLAWLPVVLQAPQAMRQAAVEAAQRAAAKAVKKQAAESADATASKQAGHAKAEQPKQLDPEEWPSLAQAGRSRAQGG